MSSAARLGALAPRARSSPRPFARDRAVRLALAAVGTLALGGLAIVSLRLALAGADQGTYLVPSAHRSFPDWMRGPLRGHGSPLTIHQFVALLAVMCSLYALAIACARALPAWLGLGAVVVLHVVFALAPPLLSTDVFNYIAYDRMAVLYHLNPYGGGPLSIAHDAVYPFVGHLWDHTPSAYGPLFTLATYPLGHMSVAGAMWTLKGATAAASLGCVALIWLCARRLGRDPLPPALFFGLNPLLLLYTVGGAHNDVMMALLLLAGVYLLLRRREALGGAALVMAVGVKLSAGLLLPFALLGARARSRFALGALAAGAVLLIGGLAVFGPRLGAILQVLSLQNRFSWVVVSVPGYVGHYLGAGGLDTARRHVLLALFAGGCALLLLRAWRRGSWLSGAGWATLLLLVTTGWLLPWYVVWLLPLAALVPRRFLPAGALALSFLLVGMQATHYLVTHTHHHRHRHVHLAHRHRPAAPRLIAPCAPGPPPPCRGGRPA